MKQLNEATKTDLINILCMISGYKPQKFLDFFNDERKNINIQRNKEIRGIDIGPFTTAFYSTTRDINAWRAGRWSPREENLDAIMAAKLFDKVKANWPVEALLERLLDALSVREFDTQKYRDRLIPAGERPLVDEDYKTIYDKIVKALVLYAFTSETLPINNPIEQLPAGAVQAPPAPEEHTFKNKHGIYICARHEDWALAGRIHDYLDGRGYQPFLDEVSLRQDDNLIRYTPVFICLLTTLPKEGEQIYKEIKAAIDSDRKIFLFIEQDFDLAALPPEIMAINNCTRFKIERTNFSSVMQKVCEEMEKQKQTLLPFLDWHKTAHTRRNVYLTSRKTIQDEIAMPENTYGASLIQSIRNGGNYTGEIPISGIRIACYSANILFAPSRTIVDKASFDGGTLSRVFSRLLKDPDFTLEVIVTAPNSPCANDAINASKLGNSARRVHPEAVFLSSYNNILTLIESDTVFREAYTTGRFQFFLAENVLPYALFQVQYKGGMEANDYIKVDLYSEGLDSNSDRRCMLIFKNDDSENYDFFNRSYDAIRKAATPSELIKTETREKWIRDWNALQRG